METLDKAKIAKALEDRLNIIENSSSNSFLEIPINRLQSRLISEWDDIGLNYLLNFQTIRYGDAINMGIYASELYQYINYSEQYKELEKEAIKLKEPNSESELEKILQRRRSVRKYKSKEMPFDIFSKILIHSQNMRCIDGMFLKNTSSGGGLYPIDLYIYTNNIDGLEKDIFKLQPISNSLHIVRKDCQDNILEILSNQEVLDLINCSMIVFFIFDYVKAYQKYSDLSLALGLIEVGIIAQTIHLLCKEYGFSSCDIGGFDKPLCEKTLNLDGIEKHSVYALIIGEEANV